MAGNDLRFKMESFDRDAILGEAGEFLDARRGRLADGRPVGETEEGRLVRELRTDRAALGESLDGYPITDEAFLSQNKPPPVRFVELSKRFRFFWIRLPIGLMPARGWAFNRLEVQVEFLPPAVPGHRAKAYLILPDQKFQTLAEANAELRLSINESFEFSAEGNLPRVDAAVVGGGAEAAISAEMAGRMGFVAGPFTYRVTKAKIQHNAVGLEWVAWRLDGAEFFRESQPDFVVIAQVPAQAEELKVSAAIQAHRYFSFAASNLQTAVQQLPEALRSFFSGGLPTVPDHREYTLSHLLASAAGGAAR
jgi:hypothetical protein